MFHGGFMLHAFYDNWNLCRRKSCQKMKFWFFSCLSRFGTSMKISEVLFQCKISGQWFISMRKWWNEKHSFDHANIEEKSQFYRIQAIVWGKHREVMVVPTDFLECPLLIKLKYSAKNYWSWSFKGDVAYLLLGTTICNCFNGERCDVNLYL